jgi:hypothetical protein
MKRGIVTVAVLSVFVLTGAVAPADASYKHKKGKTDFALFDATNPANLESGVVCHVQWQQVGKPWNFHVAVSNNGSTPQSFQLVYKDGDFVRYYVAPQSSFALTQSAGRNSSGVAIRVYTAPGSQLSGAVSAESLEGTKVKCLSCDNDADGPAACDAVIPFP